MKAGFSRACVNPPLGMPQQGLGQKSGCTRIRQDLYVQALAMEHDGNQALIIGADLLFFDRPVVDQYKAQIAASTGIAPDCILLNASHNHAGPATSSWGYHQIPDEAYLAKVGEAMTAAAVAAVAKRVPVTLEGAMTQSELPMSRRKLDDQGQAQWLPAPGAEVCKAVPFCVMRGVDGAVVALLYSASCHPSSWYENEVAGDWPGVSNELLNAHFKTEGALFLQGCAGDTKPCTVAKEGRWAAGSWDDVAAAGRLVADAITSRIAAGLQTLSPDLRNQLFEIDLPLQPPPSQDDLKKVQREVGGGQKLWADEMLARLLRDGSLPTSVPVRMHGLQLAEGLRLVSLEGEPVGIIGNRILAAFPDGITFPLGYTDGMQIYIPVDEQLPEHGYEVDSFWEYHWPAPLAPGINAALEGGLRDLREAFR